MINLNGKTAIITGGSRGIGSAIVEKFLSLGCYVIFTYNTNKDSADKILSDMKDKGYFLEARKLNLGDREDIKRFVKEINEEKRNIDILVNNAGISNVGLFIDMDDDDIDSVIDVNFKGMVYLTKYILKNMISSGRGSIVNISSIWGNTGASCEVVYSSTKGAINLFTKALAKEAGQFGIRVNCVAPGVIDTEMNGWMNEEEREELISEIPQGRFGSPYEVADAVSYLASDSSSYVNGQILTVDGGMI